MKNIFKSSLLLACSTIIISCATVDTSKLSSTEKSLIDETHKLIDSVSFGGDAALRSLTGTESISQNQGYTTFQTKFGSQNGSKDVNQYYAKYCTSISGKLEPHNCGLEYKCLTNIQSFECKTKDSTKFFYTLSAYYNKYSRKNSSMELMLYIPTNNMQSFDKAISIAKSNIETEEKRKQEAQEKYKKRMEIAKMSKKGTKICSTKTKESGWTEGAANGKLQIRLSGSNNIIWIEPNEWKTCS